jgi:hypothetical protein
LKNAGGWKPPFETKGTAKKYWDQDPHLILIVRPSAEDEEEDASDSSDDDAAKLYRPGSAASTTTTLAFPRPERRITAHVGFWRRAAISLRGNRRDSNHVVVVGPAATQTGLLYQDATALSLLLFADDAVAAIEAVGEAVESLGDILRSSTQNPKRQHPHRKAALEALSPSMEAHLRLELAGCRQLEELKRRLHPVVQGVVSATTPGSPLRRREAMRCAEAALETAMRKIASNQKQTSSDDGKHQPNEASPPNHKRGSNKKKGIK